MAPTRDGCIRGLLLFGLLALALTACPEFSDVEPRPNCDAGLDALVEVQVCPDGEGHRAVYCVAGRRRTDECGLDEWPEEEEIQQACGLGRTGRRTVSCRYRRWSQGVGWRLCNDDREGCAIRCVPGPCEGAARCVAEDVRTALCDHDTGIWWEICQGTTPAWEPMGACRDFFEAGPEACSDWASFDAASAICTDGEQESPDGRPQECACTDGEQQSPDGRLQECVHGRWIDPSAEECAAGTARPVDWCEGPGWEPCIDSGDGGRWAGVGECLERFGICTPGDRRLMPCALGEAGGGRRYQRCVDGRWVEGVCLPTCVDGTDCVVGECHTLGDSRACIATSCENGVLDGDESQIDCGGACRPCAESPPCRSADGVAGETDDE